jgi:hypothetical protein
MVEMDSPALRVALKQVEGDVIPATAGTFERNCPLVALLTDDINRGGRDRQRFFVGVARSINRTALESKKAAEVLGYVP